MFGKVRPRSCDIQRKSSVTKRWGGRLTHSGCRNMHSRPRGLEGSLWLLMWLWTLLFYFVVFIFQLLKKYYFGGYISFLFSSFFNNEGNILYICVRMVLISWNPSSSHDGNEINLEMELWRRTRADNILWQNFTS